METVKSLFLQIFFFCPMTSFPETINTPNLLILPYHCCTFFILCKFSLLFFKFSNLYICSVKSALSHTLCIFSNHVYSFHPYKFNLDLYCTFYFIRHEHTFSILLNYGIYNNCFNVHIHYVSFLSLFH